MRKIGRFVSPRYPKVIVNDGRGQRHVFTNVTQDELDTLTEVVWNYASVDDEVTFRGVTIPVLPDAEVLALTSTGDVLDTHRSLAEYSCTAVLRSEDLKELLQLGADRGAPKKAAQPEAAEPAERVAEEVAAARNGDSEKRGRRRRGRSRRAAAVVVETPPAADTVACDVGDAEAEIPIEIVEPTAAAPEPNGEQPAEAAASATEVEGSQGEATHKTSRTRRRRSRRPALPSEVAEAEQAQATAEPEAQTQEAPVPDETPALAQAGDGGTAQAEEPPKKPSRRRGRAKKTAQAEAGPSQATDAATVTPEEGAAVQLAEAAWQPSDEAQSAREGEAAKPTTTSRSHRRRSRTEPVAQSEGPEPQESEPTQE